MSSEYDDEWDAEPPASAPPGIVSAAAIVWSVVGVLLILSGLANCLIFTALVANRPGADPGLGLQAAWPSIGIGFGLILSGVRILRRKAKDVLGVAVVSILVGLGYLAVGAALATGMAGDPDIGLVIGGACAMVGLACVLAGILALAGRANPPDDEDEDEDDEDEDDRGPRGRPWDRGR